MTTRYAIKLKLGYGAQGVAFLARDRYTGQEVAIRQTIAYSPKQHTAIQEEIKMHYTLKHAFILRQLGHFVDKNMYYQILQYAAHGDLARQFYLYEKRIPEKNLVTICFYMLLALDYLHSRGIIHRDVKPQNVLVLKDPNFKAHRFLLCDFGVSRQCEQNLASTCVGTAVYMAPEVVRGEKYTSLVDIWSLGVMMHYLATGEYLFQGKDCQDIFKQILAFYVPESDLLPQMSPYFNWLLKNMLVGPEKRLSAIYLLYNEMFATRLQYCHDKRICDVSHIIPVEKIEIEDEFAGFEPDNVETEIPLEPTESSSTDYYLRASLEANMRFLKERIVELEGQSAGNAFIQKIYDLRVKDENLIDEFDCSAELKKLGKELLYTIVRYANV